MTTQDSIPVELASLWEKYRLKKDGSVYFSNVEPILCDLLIDSLRVFLNGVPVTKALYRLWFESITTHGRFTWKCKKLNLKKFNVNDLVFKDKPYRTHDTSKSQTPKMNRYYPSCLRDRLRTDFTCESELPNFDGHHALNYILYPLHQYLKDVTSNYHCSISMLFNWLQSCFPTLLQPEIIDLPTQTYHQLEQSNQVTLLTQSKPQSSSSESSAQSSNQSSNQSPNQSSNQSSTESSTQSVRI